MAFIGVAGGRNQHRPSHRIGSAAETLEHGELALVPVKKTRVLIADDHEVVRKGVAAILSSKPQFEICGEAATGREAIDAAADLQPDVVVMDVCMRDMNGVDATRQILKQMPKTQVLILSTHESDQLVRDVLSSGARGYLLKDTAAGSLLEAVEALRTNRTFFDSRVTESIMRGFQVGATAGQLSPRERVIVQLVSEGSSNREISAILKIAVKTVETHRAHIMSKLRLRSVADLVRYAIRNHIIEG
jgi:DNA-binding NarL/FixJ family response regulator